MFEDSKEEMNWQKVKNERPKAWAVFVADCFPTKEPTINGRALCYDEDWNVALQYQPRDLYDFFDSQGIYVILGDNCEWDRPKPVEFIHEVFNVRGECLYTGADNEYSTRTIAESAAFEKAFEILESRLTQNN